MEPIKADKEYKGIRFELTEPVEVTEIIDREDRFASSEVATVNRWHDGKIIFRRVVNFGSLPNSTNKAVELSPVMTNAQIDMLVDMRPIWGINLQTSTGKAYVGNWSYSGGNDIIAWEFDYDNASSNCQVECRTNDDYSGYTAYVILEYTRNDK